MGQPFVTGFVHIELGAERPLVRLAFGTGVHQRALGTRKRRGFGFVFNEVLADFRAYEFQQKTHMPEYGVVAQNRMLRLQQIVDTDSAQGCKQQTHPVALAGRQRHQQAETQACKCDEKGGVSDRVIDGFEIEHFNFSCSDLGGQVGVLRNLEERRACANEDTSARRRAIESWWSEARWISLRSCNMFWRRLVSSSSISIRC